MGLLVAGTAASSFTGGVAATAAATAATSAISFSTLASIASTAFGFINSQQQAKNQEAQAKTNRTLSERRAAEYERQAQDRLSRSEAEVDEIRRRTSVTKGSQQAKFAAKNVLLDDGTAAAVLEDTAGFGELDVLTARSNAQQDADYSRRLATNERFSGGAGYVQDINTAKNTRSAGIGSLISGAGKVADKWY